MIVIDFETHAIEGNTTVNPPKPVGVSIYKPGDGGPRYYAWGHPTGNNATYEEAKRALAESIKSNQDLLFHNAKFDLAVLKKYFGMQVSELRVYDTQYDIFLTDPYSPNLSLKPSAERLLGLPPDEQDLLRDWIVDNVMEARRKPSEWGAYISQAPAEIVGPYANGDVERTWKLFEKQHPIVNTMGMLGAYHREQRLLPIMMRSERKGIRVNVERLGRDLHAYESTLLKADAEIRKALNAPELNIDSDNDLADALEAAGLVTEWVKTATGRRSTSKKNLETALKGTVGVLPLLRYRGALSTCLSTFARPWMAQAQAAGGRIHTTWNQVRQARGSRDTKGTRTGRISSDHPNFTNIPNDFEGVEVPKGYPPLPMMRRYLLPEEGHVWIKRDFSSQEMRIAAHFAEGQLYYAYRNDPRTDPHVFVQGVIEKMTGVKLPRKPVKVTGFQILYGGGAGAVASQLGVSHDEGASLKRIYFTAMPEMEELANTTRQIGRSGKFIRTWGGRCYYSEPPKLDEKTKQYREFSYKLLNYLIQGSAADLTKQTLIEWDSERRKDDVFMAQVYDEVNVSVPEDTWEEGMHTLMSCMNRDRLDVPMLSDGFVGQNWFDLEQLYGEGR